MLCFEYYILCCSYIGFRHLLLLTGEECSNGRCVTQEVVVTIVTSCLWRRIYTICCRIPGTFSRSRRVIVSAFCRFSLETHQQWLAFAIYYTVIIIMGFLSCFFQDRCQFVIHCNKIDIFLSLFVLFAHY